MRTEPPLLGEKPRGRDSVSAAFHELRPASWHVTDAKGRTAQLCTAGYVLHFGRAYELRIALDNEGTPSDVRILSRPPFLQPREQSRVVNKHGRDFVSVPFRVERQSRWLRFFHWPYEVGTGDLEVECRRTDGADDGATMALSCPMVARTPWTAGIVMLLIAGALLGWLFGQFELLVHAAWEHGHWPPEGLGEWRQQMSNLRFWLWPLALALLNPLLALASNAYHLWQRSRRLEGQYRAFMAGDPSR